MKQGCCQRGTQHEARAGGEGRCGGGRMPLPQRQAEKGGIARHRRGQRPAEGEEAERIHAAGTDGEHGEAEVRPIQAFRRVSFIRCGCHADRGFAPGKPQLLPNSSRPRS